MSAESIPIGGDRIQDSLAQYIERQNTNPSFYKNEIDLGSENVFLFLTSVKDRRGFVNRLYRIQIWLDRMQAKKKLTKCFSHLDPKTAKQKAADFINHFEMNGSQLVYRPGYNLERRASVTMRDYQAFLDEDFIDQLAQLDNPLETFKLAESLLGLKWEAGILYPKMKSILSFLKQIEKAPNQVLESIRQNIESQGNIIIDGYGYDDNHYGDSIADDELPKDLQFLSEVIVRGGFSSDEIALMKKASIVAKLLPYKYSYSINRVFHEQKEVEDAFFVISETIRVLDAAEIMRQGFYLDKLELENYQLQDIGAKIMSGKYWITVDFLRLLQNLPVAIGPNDMYGLYTSPEIYEKPDFDEVSSEPFTPVHPYLMKNLSDQESATYYYKRRKELERVLLSPLLKQALQIAELLGIPCTTDNVLLFHGLAQLVSRIPEIINGMDETTKLTIIRDFSFNLEKFENSIFFETHLKPIFDFHPLERVAARKLFSLLRDIMRESLVKKSGVVDTNLIERAFFENYSLDNELIDYLPPDSQNFFRYYISVHPEARRVMRFNYKSAVRLFNEEEETREIVQFFANHLSAQDFIEYLDKKRLRLFVGEEIYQTFLSSLPEKNDERRNAFTHNSYDRSSALIITLCSTGDIDITNPWSFSSIAEFIRVFGLSKSTNLFSFFIALMKKKDHESTILPTILTDSNITSIELLVNEFRVIHSMMVGINPLNGQLLKQLSPVQLNLLEVGVGKTTHRFDMGRPDFSTIVSEYIEDETNGEISPVPDGYTTFSSQFNNVEITFDPTPIESEFNSLREAIIDSINEAGKAESIATELKELLIRKKTELLSNLNSLPERGKTYAQRDLSKIEKHLTNLDNYPTLDNILVMILDLNLGKGNQSIVHSLIRRVILRKVFQVHYSPGYIQDTLSVLRGEITPQAILAILNIILELVKEHALRPENNSALTQYWDVGVIGLLQQNGKKLFDAFSSSASNLKKVVDDFSYQSQGDSKTIIAVPSRDFVGEMAGYIADVCYTKEYPLLKNWPVTPFKFVLKGDNNETDELAGSVLVFDVTDTDGNDCLLIRGFDFPSESKINIEQLIEHFLDQMAEVAKKRGFKKVLVPSVTGAISNYQITISHILGKYKKDDNTVVLGDTFAFNGYDLTNSCRVAREVN